MKMTEHKAIKKKLREVFNSKLKDEVLIYVTENYESIPYLSLVKFMHDLNLPEEEEAIKIINENGYDTFGEFKYDITKTIFETTLAEINEISENKTAIEVAEIKKVLKLQTDMEMCNINDMIINIDYEQVSILIDKILKAHEVIIIGMRASNSITSYASYMLNRIGIKTTSILTADTSMYDKVQNFDRSDLVLAFGFPRYPKDTIKLLSYFKRKNFDISCITDGKNSPLANFTDNTIFVKSRSIEFTDSYINAWILINTIALTISKINQSSVIKRLNDFEETAKNLDYYF